MTIKNTDIIDYYDQCENDYRCFWNLDHSFAMHAGYWDQNTRTLKEALTKENEVLAELASVTSQDHILDAGCGVGGSSIFLAQKYGCKVTGISLSSKQIEAAKKNANKKNIPKIPVFLVDDFTATSFPDESFDVVWGIESVCHANEKSKFLEEAYRLLKPHGRLVIADAFASKKNEDSTEMKTWLSGWKVSSLDTSSDFLEKMKRTGFERISYKNITNHVLPSSKRLFYISFPAYAYTWIGEKLGFRTSLQSHNILSARYQYIALKKGLWEYGLVFGQKVQ